jgi:hypothetical protein
VLNRRNAVFGYVTFRIARRMVLRRARQGFAGLGPGTRHTAEGGQMLKKFSGSRAAADRAAALVDTIRPIVTKAMNDPELHEAVRKAFATGREVQGEISGKPKAKAARKLAENRKLQRKVETSAADLQKAVTGLVEAPKRRGRVRRVVGRVALVGGVAAAVAVALRKLRGGGGQPV